MCKFEHMENIVRIKSMVQSGLITKWDLAIKLGISRNTLDTRLDKNNWKKSELFLLRSIV